MNTIRFNINSKKPYPDFPYTENQEVWLGLRDGVGALAVCCQIIDARGTVHEVINLGSMNDTQCFTFKEIAHFIRSNPTYVFTNLDKC